MICINFFIKENKHIHMYFHPQGQIELKRDLQNSNCLAVNENGTIDFMIRIISNKIVKT